ncbi:hypothetical protein P1J78_12200 [Psychromarinibacter sp. C21-152]|uniref:Uncharacterized protein n=1 Tax=Psychromarinibacter sediminicola TaxID=3033385 RepID=A0AAE3NSY5_9RHOB|nr:hypothetical protein [Psychromarinibacter sediminicola]MDF0601497.1 hypothetical protein [Psychromarinibacter sediminicola]
MADEEHPIEDMTVPLLRQIQGQLARIESDLSDVKERLTAIELLNANTNQRLDRFETRLMRIERRLEILDE